MKRPRPAVPGDSAHRIANTQLTGVLCTGRARWTVRTDHGGSRHRATAQHPVVPVALTRSECVLSDAMAAAVDNAGQRNQNRPSSSRMVGKESSAAGYARSDSLIWHWSSFTEGSDASASAGCGAPTPRNHPSGPFAVRANPKALPVEGF